MPPAAVGEDKRIRELADGVAIPEFRIGKGGFEDCKKQKVMVSARLVLDVLGEKACGLEFSRVLSKS